MKLNPYEKEIITYLISGLTQKEIANNYRISHASLCGILKRAREKNNMLSNIQMAVEAKLKNIV